jgi:hypothetical protein
MQIGPLLFRTYSGVTRDESVTVPASGPAPLPADAVPPSSSAVPSVAKEVPQFDEEAWAASVQTYFARGKDLQQIAQALAVSMQDLIRERPDLAQAKFDFASDKGVIRVTSRELGAADRAWLERKLNGNAALAEAVKRFHDDAVDVYALTRKSHGQPIDDAEYQKASNAVDEMYQFMDLLGDVADGIRKDYQPTTAFSYQDVTGAPLAFDADPSSAAGLLDFMDRIQLLESGPLTVVTHKSHTLVPFNDPFALAGMRIAAYDPKSPDREPGLHVQA